MDQVSSTLCATQALKLYASQIQTKAIQLIGPTPLNRKLHGHVLGLEHDLGGVSPYQTKLNYHIEVSIHPK